MKRKRSLLVATGILLFSLILITNAFSQVWDNKWFKFKGKARGYVLHENGKLVRTSFKGKSYIFFHWNSANNRYDLMHWVENGNGEWDSFNGILPQPIGNNEVLWRDIYTRLQKGDDWIWVYATARMRIRHNESVIIEHARFKSMGCESPMGSIDGQQFGGKCKLRGKMIEAEDLPPDFPLSPGKAEENPEQKSPSGS